MLSFLGFSFARRFCENFEIEFEYLQVLELESRERLGQSSSEMGGEDEDSDEFGGHHEGGFHYEGFWA